MFYLTNIAVVVALSENTFTQKSSSDYLMLAEATNQWVRMVLMALRLR